MTADPHQRPHTRQDAGEAWSPEELARYGRHLLLPEVGLDGQGRLRRARVLLIGAGGLGSPCALYLAAAGVGRLGLVDFDRVDISNLQRQVLHTTGDIGRSKIQSARETIEALNPHVHVEAHEFRLTADRAMDLLAGYDVVVDGTDNFATRYLVNDACVLLGKPNVHGSVFRFEGQASVFWTPRGPCYRCLYPEPPPPELAPNCAEAGVLGVLPGLIGLVQATETIKIVLGQGDLLVGRLLLYHAMQMRFRELGIPRDPACPVCGDHPTIRTVSDLGAGCSAGASTARPPEDDRDVSARDLKREVDQRAALVLVDVREPHEWEAGHLRDAVHIPLGRLAARANELDRDANIVCYCRSGARSARAANLLRKAGFKRVRNLVGGLLAWSSDVDPSIPVC